MISTKNALLNFFDQTKQDNEMQLRIFSIAERILQDSASPTTLQVDIKLAAAALKSKIALYLKLVGGQNQGHTPSGVDLENLIISQLIIELAENPLCNQGLKFEKMKALVSLLETLIAQNGQINLSQIIASINNSFPGWADRQSLPKKLQAVFPSRIEKLCGALFDSRNRIPSTLSFTAPNASSTSLVSSIVTPHSQQTTVLTAEQASELLATVRALQDKVIALENRLASNS